MTVDDYLKIQTLGAVEVSGASDLVAVLISRPSQEGDNFRVPSLSESRIPLRNDLLVISATDGRLVFRDEGLSDGGSVLFSRWSPDGSALAYLRADRTGQVSLKIWNAGSGQERTLVEGVRPFFPYIRHAGPDESAAAIAWMNNEQVMFTQAGDF